MDPNELMALEAEIVKTLKDIYDPEIPVNIYDLGLIYAIDVDDDKNVEVKMTLTAPNCPMADQLLGEVNEKTNAIEGVKEAKINLVFDPPWDKSLMSEEAMLDLGLL
ncbi:MAG: FeS assembly SUF system protein [Marinilabiliales bacterium]|nr:MAG: FeS assembly SUF system protein [Marinilabiliales bacterium]